PRPDTTLPFETLAPFYNTLTRDLATSSVFALAPVPPNVPVNADLVRAANAEFALSLKVLQDEQDMIVEARMIDGSGAAHFGRRYRGIAVVLPRMAHILANDLVRAVNGRPGIFLSQIAFASNRTGAYEIWLMDWDGSNQRRISAHNGLAI